MDHMVVTKIGVIYTPIYVFQWEIRIDTALQEKEKFLPTYM